MSAESPAGRTPPQVPLKSKSVLDSFRYAMDGMTHVIHSQRHVRYYFVAIALVMLLSLLLRVTKFELVMLSLTIGLVLIAELFNTAIEVVVDMVTESYHPRARIAKDVAGAGVLVATVVSVLVAGLVFLDQPKLRSYLAATRFQAPPNVLHVALVGLIVVSILVVLGKVRGRTGTLLKGGVISGHSALAAFLATAIYYVTGRNALVLALAGGLACLVCQSRVDAGIHSLKEVLLGAALATLIGVLLFGYLR